MEPAIVSETSLSFSGLSLDERHYLSEWQASARAIGIDAVEDLTRRPWPCPVPDTVIGVFHAESNAARWLVVGQGGAWAVACCAEGTASPTLNSLAEALAVIYSGPATAGRH